MSSAWTESKSTIEYDRKSTLDCYLCWTTGRLHTDLKLDDYLRRSRLLVANNNGSIWFRVAMQYGTSARGIPCQVCLLSRGLVVTHQVCIYCLGISKRQIKSSQSTLEDDSKGTGRTSRSAHPLFSHHRLPTFPSISNNTVTLAYSDEPYNMKKYGKLTENRFHELQHESKIRLLKTYSHKGPLNSEATKLSCQTPARSHVWSRTMSRMLHCSVTLLLVFDGDDRVEEWSRLLTTIDRIDPSIFL